MLYYAGFVDCSNDCLHSLNIIKPGVLRFAQRSARTFEFSRESETGRGLAANDRRERARSVHFHQQPEFHAFLSGFTGVAVDFLLGGLTEEPTSNRITEF